MNFDLESIKKHLEDDKEFKDRIEKVIRILESDLQVIITDIYMFDDNDLHIDYDYFARGYRYDSCIIIPISLLNATKEELVAERDRRIERAKKLQEEERKKSAEENIRKEKEMLARLKAKYES